MSVVKSFLQAGSFTLGQVEPAVKRGANTISKGMDFIDAGLDASKTYAQRWALDAKVSLLDSLDERIKQSNTGETRKEYLTRIKQEYKEVDDLFK